MAADPERHLVDGLVIEAGKPEHAVVVAGRFDDTVAREGRSGTRLLAHDLWRSQRCARRTPQGSAGSLQPERLSALSVHH